MQKLFQDASWQNSTFKLSPILILLETVKYINLKKAFCPGLVALATSISKCSLDYAVNSNCWHVNGGAEKR